MSIRASIVSNDLEAQIEQLRKFPELVDKHFRPAMQHVTGALEGSIAPNIPTMTGEARGQFGSKVEGQGVKLTGVVGFFGSRWQINIVEYGAQAHTIVPKNAQVLHFGDTFAQVVDHPGLQARQFMKAGFAQAGPLVESVFGVASELLTQEMAVNEGAV